MHDESLSAAAPDGIEAATVKYLTISIIGFKARNKPVFLEGDSDVLWQMWYLALPTAETDVCE